MVKEGADLTVGVLQQQYDKALGDKSVEEGILTVSELVSIYSSNTNPPSKSQKNNYQKGEVSITDQAVVVYELDNVIPNGDKLQQAGGNEYLLDVIETQTLQPSSVVSRVNDTGVPENHGQNEVEKLPEGANVNNGFLSVTCVAEVDQNSQSSFDANFPPLSLGVQSKRASITSGERQEPLRIPPRTHNRSI